VKGFKPAMEPPAPLPDPQANECKPNVFGVGPGTCRKTPQARGTVSRLCRMIYARNKAFECLICVTSGWL